MKYGMNLLLWTGELTNDIIPVLESLKEMGYDGVELPLFNARPEECQRWAQILDDLELERTAVTVRNVEDNPISSDPKVRELALVHNKRALDCCEAIGANLLVGPYHSAIGHFSGKGPSEEEWKAGVDHMRALSEYAKSKNVTLGLEYLNRFECYFLTNTTDTKRFVRDVDHENCKMIYDTFHANIEEKSFTHSIRSARNEIVHVHVSENDRGTPGEGHLDWGKIFGALNEARYDGWLTIEAFGTSLPELAAATKIWRKMYKDEMQLAREGLEFMRYWWEDKLANPHRQVS